MKCIGIISAFNLEMELIKNQIENIKTEKICGINYYEGNIGKQSIVLVACGIGKVNASIATQIMIDKFNVEAIIHTGIAGSLSEKVRHLDIVIADSLTYYDVRKEQLKTCFPFQEYFLTDKKITETILQVIETNKHVGTIISGEDFISSKEKKEALKSRFPEALCVEMEGGAIAHTAFVNDIPFTVIRCISDLADDAVDSDYDKFELDAAHKGADVVLKFLSKFN